MQGEQVVRTEGVSGHSLLLDTRFELPTGESLLNMFELVQHALTTSEFCVAAFDMYYVQSFTNIDV